MSVAQRGTEAAHKGRLHSLICIAAEQWRPNVQKEVVGLNDQRTCFLQTCLPFNVDL